MYIGKTSFLSRFTMNSDMAHVPPNANVGNENASVTIAAMFFTFLVTGDDIDLIIIKATKPQIVPIKTPSGMDIKDVIFVYNSLLIGCIVLKCFFSFY